MDKKYSYIGVSFIILIFGIYVVPKVVKRFNEGSIVEADRLNKVENKTDTEGSLSSDLYMFRKVPNFEFINQNGETISNKTFEGKVYVAEFFFTTCPTICPIMNRKMLNIQNEFYKNPNFGIASFSITPEIDRPEVLKQYATKHKITNKNWHLLTGKNDSVVYELANEGFKLYTGKTDGNHGGFEHSGLFALIDKNGNIRSRKDKHGNPIMYYRALKENGFSDQIDELKEDIKLLLNE